MTFSLLLTLSSAFIGILIGGIQGYLGGKVDITLQRIIEIWAPCLSFTWSSFSEASTAAASGCCFSS